MNGVAGSWNDGASDGATCQNFATSSIIGVTGSSLTTADFDLRGSCDSTCTQQTTGVCSAEFLAGVIKGDGVKTAYCNDKWLVIGATGEINTLTTESDPTFNANLNDVPFPPAARISGTSYRTGIDSIDSTKAQTLYYPLTTADHSTASASNNKDVYDVTTGAGAYSFLIDNEDSSLQ